MVLKPKSQSQSQFPFEFEFELELQPVSEPASEPASESQTNSKKKKSRALYKCDRKDCPAKKPYIDHSGHIRRHWDVEHEGLLLAMCPYCGKVAGRSDNLLKQ